MSNQKPCNQTIRITHVHMNIAAARNGIISLQGPRVCGRGAPGTGLQATRLRNTMISCIKPARILSTVRRVASVALESRTVAARAVSTKGALNHDENPLGVKTILRHHLAEAGKPLTSAELWQRVEADGVKSKRHMKLMLQQMREANIVATKPVPATVSRKTRQFAYQLGPASYEMKEQRKQEQKQQERATSSNA